MQIRLHNDLIVLPVVNKEAALISCDIHSLIEGSPRGLCNDVILWSSNFLLAILVFVEECLLEVVDANV